MIITLLYDLLYAISMVITGTKTALFYLSTDKMRTTIFFSSQDIKDMEEGKQYILDLPGTKNKGVLIIAILMVIAILIIRHVVTQNKTIAIITFAVWAVAIGVAAKIDGHSIISGRSMWILNGIIAGILTVILSRLMDHFKWLRLLVAAGLMGGMVTLLILRQTPEKLTVASAFLFILLTAVDFVQMYWKKSGDCEHKKHLVFIAPFLIILAIVLYKSPAPKKPYDWRITKTIAKVVKNTAVDVSNKIRFGSGGDFSESFIGFSDKGTLGSHKIGKPVTVMKVALQSDVAPSIYLRGKTFDKYTQKGWESKGKFAYDDMTLDMLTMVASVNDYDSANIKDYFKYTTAKIIYQSMYTKHFFTPTKTDMTSKALEDMAFEIKDNDVYFKKKKGADTQYTTKFMRLNYGKEVFDDFIKAPHSMSEESWQKAVTAYGLQNDENYSYAKYGKWVDEVNEIYGENIELSEELKAYLNKLFEDADSDYERLMILQNELQSYSYNASPGSLPKEIKTASAFLDYFMLETKAGYCTYFATAFTLLARSMGLPARYVQGYYIPTKANSTLIITSDLAHAWPEVYLEGIGWLQFEPTPGYMKTGTWMTGEEMRKMMAEARSNLNFGGNNEEDYKSSDDNVPVINAKVAGESGFKWYYPIWALIAIVVLSLILLIADTLLINARFKKMTGRKLMTGYCRRNMRLLSCMGLPIKEGETLQEYKNRLGKELSHKALDFLGSYEKLLYSAGFDEKSEILICEMSNERLRNTIKEERKLWYVFDYLKSIR